MFSKMLGKKNKDDEEHVKFVAMLHKMNLTEKRDYIKNKLSNSPTTHQGIVEILKKMTSQDEKTSKRYIEIDDMDVKKKKAFDLIITISTHNMLSIECVDLIKKFVDMYEDIIIKFDKDNKQIYASRLNSAVKNAILTINAKSEIENKRQVLK